MTLLCMLHSVFLQHVLTYSIEFRLVGAADIITLIVLFL